MMNNIERWWVVAALLAILSAPLFGANPGECCIYVYYMDTRTKFYARVFIAKWLGVQTVWNGGFQLLMCYITKYLHLTTLYSILHFHW